VPPLRLARSPTARQTILFLAANPSGADRLALDREAHSIREELKRSGYRDRFEFVAREAMVPLDLLRALREVKPTVVHFSGLAGQSGLVFHAADGRAQVVSPKAIADAFGAAGASVRLVVLSACYSDASADALLAHVDCVVGMGGTLQEDAAKAFAVGFYGALGEDESVTAAYRHGNAAIGLEGLFDVERPQLRVRAALDADRVFPATTSGPPSPSCPYPGMRPYTADDAEQFHGRDAEIAEILGRLRAGEREIYVIGPSGSGKSSLLAAGVLPRLARGAAGLGSFLVRTMRPGETPATRLRDLLELSHTAPANGVLAHRADGPAALIVVDQLEELFTLASPDEREQFLVVLSALHSERRCVVVFTLRADFYGDFMESPLWTDCSGRISRIELGPLRGAALRDAIARPARELGVVVQPDLIERLLADAASEPGILPLLQETLVQLWDQRQDETLTLAHYQALGDRDRSGLAVALSRRADATLRDLSPEQEAIARRIFLRLVSFGEGRSDIRRQQPRSKLRAAANDPADFDHVVQRLISDRLLVTDDDDHGEPRVDLAHEIMISAWPTLAGWIQDRRAAEQRRRHIELTAAQWIDRGRGTRGLLDPIELAEVEAWRRTESAREVGESAEVAALIAASTAESERQTRQEALRDLRVARQIQRNLLPANVPKVVGLEFAVHYEPAYHIGGDFYDFIWHDPSHLGLAVGDVAGKAISAALYMARLTSELRSRAAIARTPARLLRRVNQEIAQLDDDGMFATMVYCIYDLDNRSLVFTNAGHCVPLLRRGDRVYPLQAERAHTPPLGVTPELEAGEARVQLYAGDMLILVTDGILEARDTRGNDYGLSRLSRRIRTARGNVDDVVKAILADIDSHCGEHGQQGDDMTLVAMSIDQRRPKRSRILPGEGPTRPTTDVGTEASDHTIDSDDDE
jgi:serine phosphatase RsbU (regulator of sigma subunit)